MGKIKDYLLGKEPKVEVPSEPSNEEAWLSSNFTFRWVCRLKDWGYAFKDFNLAKEKTKKKDEHIIFSFYGSLLDRHKKELLVLQSLYYEMAMMQAELGEDPKRYLELSHKSILDYYRSTKKVTSVFIENSGKDACNECKKLDGWILTLAQAEKKKILPHRKCTKKHGKVKLCRCTYGPMKEIQ